MSKKKNKVISGSPEKIKLLEKIDQNFRISQHYCKQIEKRYKKPYTIPEKPVQKRRTEAIMHYMPVVTEHFKDKYTQDTIQDIFTRFCCAFDMECHSIGEKDSDFRWSTAASIWILDELEESNKLSEVNFDSYDYEDGTLPPLLTDCVHPVEMLWSIIILMQKQMTDAHNRKLMFHSQNAKYGDEKSEDDIKYHSDFMNIIKLLNPEHVQNAVERLKQIIWKIMDIYFECEVRYDSTSSYKNPERKMEYKYINHMSTLIGIRIPTSKITTETFNNFPDSVAEVLLQYHENFFIEKPFELCFAIFYLIAVGDDLAWLYTPFLLILEKCGDVFPWCIDEEWFKSLEELKKFNIQNTEYYINNAINNGKKILAEGAQATMLDIDFGSYPFVTSSSTISAGVCSGLGIAPTCIGRIYGTTKAYCTRVGSGPFPTELFDEMGEKLCEQGHEYGVTTGRKRRTGWLDLVALKYACMINGVTDLMLMKIDVMDNFETVKLCEKYSLDGTQIDYIPYSMSSANLSPVYTEYDGWLTNVSKIREFEDLPKNMKTYIKAIEDKTGIRVSLISVSPDREDTIFRNK